MAEKSSPPAVAVEQQDACRISNWYPKLSKYSIRTVLVPVPEDFLQYLLADGVVLPELPEGEKPHRNDPRYTDAASSVHSTSSEESDRINDSGSDSTPLPPQSWCFPQLEADLNAALTHFPDGAFVKGAWSAPNDAEWATGTLCCYSPGAVYMLLKCSDFVTYELQHGYDHCVESSAAGAEGPPAPPLLTHVALRSWSNLHRSNEFRVFVANDDIVAFSQRHTDAHFDHLGGDGGAQLAARVLEWWQGGLAEDWPHTHYVMDVYVAKTGAVRLLDLSPYGGATVPLLFSWEEIQLAAQHVAAVDAGTATAGASTGGQTPLAASPGTHQVFLPTGAALRTVEQAGVRPSKLAMHGLPTDIVQLASSLAAGEVPDDVAAYAAATAEHASGTAASASAAALQEAASVDAMVAAMKAAEQ